MTELQSDYCVEIPQLDLRQPLIFFVCAGWLNFRKPKNWRSIAFLYIPVRIGQNIFDQKQPWSPTWKQACAPGMDSLGMTWVHTEGFYKALQIAPSCQSHTLLNELKTADTFTMDDLTLLEWYHYSSPQGYFYYDDELPCAVKLYTALSVVASIISTPLVLLCCLPTIASLKKVHEVNIALMVPSKTK